MIYDAGARLLERVIQFCKLDPAIFEAYLHVQDNNDDAVRFYSKFGFSVTGREENYYKRLDPPHALILSKTLTENVNVS